jgi:uncharacterized membrane protein YecN with MAPEG domain
MILTTTLSAAAAAALINIWLMVRCGKIRTAEKILIGDGGSQNLIRRMRAQANFVESTPFVLILIALIELAGKGGQWLAIVSAVYMLMRVAHAVGLDKDGVNPYRFVGTMTTILTQLGLGVVAVLIMLEKI